MITYERTGPVAVLTINRPDRRNAVDAPTAAALGQAFRSFEADDEAAVLVVTGAGGDAFCAGADLRAAEGMGARATHPDGPEGFTRLASSKPTIAAVSGWAVGGGFELALWCDLRIATSTATFGFFERRWGVPLLDGGTQRLPRIVGQGRALELILTGRAVDADEALRIGLVNEVVEPGAHVDRAVELGTRLAGFPPQAMHAARHAALQSFENVLPHGLALEQRLGLRALDEAHAGAAEFAAGAGRGGKDVWS